MKKEMKLYNGDRTLFTALKELKRMVSELDLPQDEHYKDVELSLAIEDIEKDILRHMKFNLIDRNAEIHFDMGEMTEEEYFAMQKGEADLKPHEKELDPRFMYPENK